MKPALNDNHFARTMLDHPAHEHLWWENAEDRLEWRPIREYMEGELELGSPVVLRSADHWVLGCWTDGGWAKFTEGGCWSIDGFEPIEWAHPALEELMMLAQE